MSACTCAGNQLHLALEAERLDTSWRRTATRVATVPSPRAPTETPADRKQRDIDFYNAGRYAAGARDRVAEAASKKINKKGINA